jgi:hypothetical protein
MQQPVRYSSMPEVPQRPTTLPGDTVWKLLVLPIKIGGGSTWKVFLLILEEGKKKNLFPLTKFSAQSEVDKI